MAKLFETVALVLTMLVVGSFNTINTKLQFQTRCPTLPAGSGTHFWNKPWLSNLFMFGGETLLLLPITLRAMVKKRYQELKARKLAAMPLAPAGPLSVPQDLQQPFMGQGSAKRTPAYIFAIPAMCDVFATGFGSIAMMYIDAAVWQMMRGSIIVFSAILSVAFLRRMLHIYHWVGVFFTVIGIFVIGCAAVMGQTVDQAESSNMGMGISMVILAQMFSAFQFTFEEHLLTGYSVSSLQCVAYEGCWGLGYMIIILIAMTMVGGNDHGSFESLSDGVYMFTHSGQQEFLMVSYMFSVAFYNFVGMQLCRKLSAVTRCLVDCARTGTVWAFQLAVHYFVSPQYGQAWNQYSWLQAVGFGLLILGSLIYNGVVRLPSVNYRKLNRRRNAKLMRATWSPTMNRGAKWGLGKDGPQSPHAADSPNQSPLAGPFGSPPGADRYSGSPGVSPGGADVGVGKCFKGEADVPEKRFKGQVVMAGMVGVANNA